MKKLIIVLMMVAMASFLFVGCLPGITTPDTTTDTTTTTTTPTTVVPVITDIDGISLTGTAEYINATEAAVVIVSGTAPTLSEVKVYVDGICAGTGDVGIAGTWDVVIAEADLGADGAKTLYATATDVGLPESAHSVEYEFILDQVAPSATTIAATAETAAVAVVSTCLNVGGLLTIPTLAGVTVITAADLVVGVWRIDIMGLTNTANNVIITSPAGVATNLSNVIDAQKIYTIPGVEVDMVGGTLTVAESYTVTCAAATALVAGRATVLYSEPVTFATCDLGVFTGIAWTLGVPHGTPVAETFLTYVVDTSYYTLTAATPALSLYDTVRVVVNAMIDLAGNTQTTASSLTCTVGTASATSLAP